MPKSLKNTISQTALKHYNEFRNVRTEGLRWVKITTDTGIKFKVENHTKKEINNYWNSLPLIYLNLNRNILKFGIS